MKPCTKQRFFKTTDQNPAARSSQWLGYCSGDGESNEAVVVVVLSEMLLLTLYCVC